MIDEVTKAGMQSMKQGSERVAKAANELSNAFLPESDSDAVKSSIELHEGQREFSIGAKLIKVADKMRSTILDIFA